MIRNRALRRTICAGALIYLALAVTSLDVNWLRVYEGLDRGWRFVQGFLLPDFASRWSDIAIGMQESLTMTVTSTVVGVLISVPIGIGAARNLAPPPVYLLCRGVIALSRSFQEIIIAILFVAMFGFGPFAGFLTLSFATIGFLSKLLAEDIEDVDESQAEAIRATGAGWWQLVNYAIQPQVMPRLMGLSFYRLDINFRESAVDRHRRCRRHRRYIEHGHRPLRIRLRRRDSDRHYPDRHGGRIPFRLRAQVGAVTMSPSTSAGNAVWRYRTPRRQLALWAGWLALVALFIFCWKVMTKDTIWSFVSRTLPRQAADIGDRMIPPGLGYFGQLIVPLWDTLNIATLGTLIAITIAVPVAFLAARNTTPSTRIVRPLAIFIIVASRSINSLIWGLLLVMIIGPGVLAGVIAIALRSIGFVAKLLYEAIEEIDETQVEAVTATGASRLQVLDQAIVPQVMPAFCRYLGVPVGHQHPRVNGAWPGRSWRPRSQARGFAQHLGMESGDYHFYRDPGDGRAQRMGVSSRPSCCHLTRSELSERRGLGVKRTLTTIS